jgi:hypothetical protein
MAAPERFAETSDSSLASRAPSIHGTSQTSGDVPPEPAKWVKADIDQVAVADAAHPSDATGTVKPCYRSRLVFAARVIVTGFQIFTVQSAPAALPNVK